MTQAEINIKVKSIFDMIEPALKKKVINGSVRYETAWGSKTKEGLLKSIERILSDE